MPKFILILSVALLPHFASADPVVEWSNSLSGVYRQCENSSQCKGLGNRCAGGRCTEPGFSCDSADDCPGSGNRCAGGRCTRQEALCEDASQCPGINNRCVAGRCSNP